MSSSEGNRKSCSTSRCDTIIGRYIRIIHIASHVSHEPLVSLSHLHNLFGRFCTAGDVQQPAYLRRRSCQNMIYIVETVITIILRIES